MFLHLMSKAKKCGSLVSGLILLVLLVACDSKTDTNPIVKPSNLIYSPDSLVFTGAELTSSVPSISNGGEAVVYRLGAGISGITINSGTGVISVSGTPDEKRHVLSVVATNSAGSTTFSNAFKVIVKYPDTALKPQSISYSPSSVELFESEEFTADATINNGGSAVTSMAIVPEISGLTINPSTGAITVGSETVVGTHQVSVKLSNAIGDSVFQNVFTATIKAVSAPSDLTYTPNPLIVHKGDEPKSSDARVLAGDSSQVKFYVLSQVNGIEIDSLSGKITADTLLDIGTYKVSVRVKNSKQHTDFTDVLEIEVNPVRSDVVQSMSYSPNSFDYYEGRAKSATATVSDDGGSAPTNFSLLESPSGISIDAKSGTLTFSATVLPADYSLSVTVSNTNGDTTFTDIFKATVKAVTSPEGLTYAPNPLTLDEGTAGTATASLSEKGDSEASFELINSVAGVSITDSTGTISVASSVATGTYQLSVKVSNTKKSSDFNNILTLNVNAKAKVTFNGDIKQIFVSNCSGSSCHVGGPKPDWSVYTTAKNNVDEILRRIQLSTSENGSMPPSGKLPQATIDKIKQWKTDGLEEGD